MKQKTDGYTIMDTDCELVEFDLEGNVNVIPHSWYKNLKTDNGKPNSIAIILLSDIVYWYRPIWIRDEVTGQTIGKRKRFESDKLQRSYKQYCELFGFTYKQVRDAIKFLADKNIITTELRVINTGKTIASNVMYIGLNVSAVAAITLDYTTPSALQGRPSALQGRTYTKTTTKNHIRFSKKFPKASTNQPAPYPAPDGL